MASSGGGRRDPAGLVRLKVLAVLLVLVGMGYVASKIIPPYWDYLSLHDPIKEAAIA